jgi:hypothetical protein
MNIVASLHDLAALAQPFEFPDDVAVGGPAVKVARHAQPRLAFGPADAPRRRRQNILAQAP